MGVTATRRSGAPRRARRPRRRDARRRSATLTLAGARAGTTCRTRWRRSRSASSWACRSNASRPGSTEFRGAERRFEVRGEPNGILVVDDYGHHPTEIAAVLAAARTLGRRIVVAFQPHRYTRTAALMDAFGPALAGADHIVLTDIYAAGEDPIPGVTLDALAAAVRRSVDRAGRRRAARSTTSCRRCVRMARPGDVVITLGAGSIGTRARSQLRRRRSSSARERARERGCRAGRSPLPPRARQAGAQADGWRGAGVQAAADRAALALAVLCRRLPRRAAVVGARARAAGRAHRRARQRAAVEGRGARGARAGCAART